MGKTIAERLREADETACATSDIAHALGWDDVGCGKGRNCIECTAAAMWKLADEIEGENIEFLTIGYLDGLKGPDTQEAIDGDAAMAPLAYCEKHGIYIEPGTNESETIEIMCEDLLRRQRKLLGGE